MSILELLTALGPLASLYCDPNVIAIMVDAPDKVRVNLFEKYSLDQIKEAEVRFASPEALQQTIDHVLVLCGVTLGPGETIAEVRLPDSQAHMVVVLPPTALNGPYLVIRKSRPRTLTWNDLFNFGCLTRQAYELIQSALQAEVNILVSGGTSSGKTTLTNMLVDTLPVDQHIVVVEALHEIELKHPGAIFLEYSNQAAASLAKLYSTASILWPDWLIFGELHGPDAARALEILRNGHSGMSTIHAENPEDALNHLETYCLMANLGLGLVEIRTMIAHALRVIVHIDRLPAGRRVMEIVELCGLENDRYVLQPLMRYNPETDRIEETGVKPGWG
jgi:pilus assembly protein CpaF